MHLTKQSWRHAELALERLDEAWRRRQPDLRGDGFQCHSTGKQQARGIKPRGFDEVRGGGRADVMFFARGPADAY